jgi:heme A synthase
MNKTITYIAYTFIGLLTLIAGVGIVKVLIHIGVEMLGLIFNQPIIALAICIAVLATLFLIPDRK